MLIIGCFSYWVWHMYRIQDMDLFGYGGLILRICWIVYMIITCFHELMHPVHPFWGMSTTSFWKWNDSFHLPLWWESIIKRGVKWIVHIDQFSISWVAPMWVDHSSGVTTHHWRTKYPPYCAIFRKHQCLLIQLRFHNVSAHVFGIHFPFQSAKDHPISTNSFLYAYTYMQYIYIWYIDILQYNEL